MKTFLIPAAICVVAGILIGTSLWEREVRIAAAKKAAQKEASLAEAVNYVEEKRGQLWEIQREKRKAYEAALKSKEDAAKAFDELNREFESAKRRLESIETEQREIDSVYRRTPY